VEKARTAEVGVCSVSVSIKWLGTGQAPGRSIDRSEAVPFRNFVAPALYDRGHNKR
jgi:hypothetical protein